MRWGITGLLLAVLSVGVPATGASGAADRAQSPAAAHCAVWKQTRIASSLGILESLLPDNHGGMLLSSTSHNAVERLTPNGHVTVVAKAASPGELVWHGPRTVMFPTGDSLASGATDQADGTLQLLNLRSHRLATYATGLTMPNGLALDRDGTAYVTRDLGGGTGITRVSAKPGHRVTTNWSALSDDNGIAIDVKRRVMYVDQTFTVAAPVVQVSMRHPDQTEQIGNLAGLGGVTPKLLDDLTMAPSGVLYIPGNGAGDLFSFDPRTKQSCLIATGLGNPSDVTIGTGHGWRKGALFVCGFDGTVREFARAPG
jgi:sugar lactone lactonase YvrE